MTKFELLLAYAPLAVAVLDRDMRYLCASQRWLADYRLGVDVRGKSHYQVIPEIPEEWKVAYHRALDGEALRFEKDCLQRADGCVQWLCWEVRPWRRRRGQIGGIIIFSEDITERIRFEELARRNELRLQFALDMAPLISFDWEIPRDEARRLSRIDHEAPPRVAVFSSLESVQAAVHPDDLEQFCADVQDALSNEAGNYESEIRVIVPGGDIVRRLARGQVLRDANGQPARLIGVAQDITERKRADDALRDANLHKDIFLATLAHELRNPLAPIMNSVHVLRRHLEANEENGKAHQLLGIIGRQTNNLVRLVDDILEISRITQGKIDLRHETIEIADVLRNAIEAAQPSFESALHHLEVHAEQGLLVRGDPLRLAQIFTNLLNNAAKYTKAGGSIFVSAARSGNEAVTSIADDGCGIPPDMLTSIFELFTQVDRTLGRSQAGVGMSLASARRLIRLHGGAIDVHSDGLGRGSTFTVRLPLVGK